MFAMPTSNPLGKRTTAGHTVLSGEPYAKLRLLIESRLKWTATELLKMGETTLNTSYLCW